MANMSLDAYTFDFNPMDPLQLIRKKRAVAAKKTYSAAVTFSFPATIAGQKRKLNWKYMPTSMFATLDTKYTAGGSYVFDPQDGSSKTYNVEIMDFDGEYHLDLEDTAGNYYKNVVMELYFLSEVT